ncbi:MAG: hypothetical protein AB7E52_05285, partial [Bdellovibrionales bacterium]
FYDNPGCQLMTSAYRLMTHTADRTMTLAETEIKDPRDILFARFFALSEKGEISTIGTGIAADAPYFQINRTVLDKLHAYQGKDTQVQTSLHLNGDDPLQVFTLNGFYFSSKGHRTIELPVNRSFDPNDVWTIHNALAIPSKHFPTGFVWTDALTNAGSVPVLGTLARQHVTGGALIYKPTGSYIQFG